MFKDQYMYKRFYKKVIIEISLPIRKQEIAKIEKFLPMNTQRPIPKRPMIQSFLPSPGPRRKEKEISAFKKTKNNRKDPCKFLE